MSFDRQRRKMLTFSVPEVKKEDLEDKKHGKKKECQKLDFFSKFNDNMKEETLIKSSLWSNLQVDLLEEIVGRLHFSDVVRFHAVCKSWLAVQSKIRTTYLFPWVIKIGRPSLDTFECRLYEPSSSSSNMKLIAIHSIYLDLYVSSYPLCFDTDIDISCKDGWLLFAIPSRDFAFTTFLFYSPLTKKVRALPELDHDRGSYYELSTTFTTDPDSPDFVFLVVKYYLGTYYIINYSHREKRWSTDTFEYNKPYYVGRGSIIVYMRKMFYFVDTIGHVVSYNLTDGICKLEDASHDRTIRSSRMRYVFELNGELMLVYCDDDLNCRVSSFDWYQKRWIPVNDLGNRALFVGVNSFSVSAVGEEATNNGIFPNNIYVLLDSGCKVYSLGNGEPMNSLESPGFKIWEANIYVHNKLTFWLEPPDNVLNQKQQVTGWGTVEELSNLEVDQVLDVASTSKRGWFELLTTNGNEESTVQLRDQIIEDDMPENQSVLRQLKRSRSEQKDLY